MSHITKHAEKFRDINLLCSIALELGHEVNAKTEVHMFGSQKVEAVVGIKLTGWRYELAIDKDGNLYYDHFGSHSNTMQHLGTLQQQYKLRRTEAIIPFDEVETYHVETLENGDIKMVLEYA